MHVQFVHNAIFLVEMYVQCGALGSSSVWLEAQNFHFISGRCSASN